MNNLIKPVEFLQMEDLEKFPVWTFVNDDVRGETLVKPVKKYPVRSLTGKIVGVKVRLAGQSEVWATIGNVHLDNYALSEHFISISFNNNGKWFNLSRYHDFDYEQYGPQALSAFLERSVEEIFPIVYDLSPFAVGDKKVLVGKIYKEPEQKLSRAEIIALAVP